MINSAVAVLLFERYVYKENERKVQRYKIGCNIEIIERRKWGEVEKRDASETEGVHPLSKEINIKPSQRARSTTALSFS